MIELLIAMSIMSIGILAVFALFQTGMVTIRRASTVSTAAALADSEMEDYRAGQRIGLDRSSSVDRRSGESGRTRRYTGGERRGAVPQRVLVADEPGRTPRSASTSQCPHGRRARRSVPTEARDGRRRTRATGLTRTSAGSHLELGRRRPGET